MAEHAFAPGDRVRVFHDPITTTKIEGDAVVTKLLDVSNYYEVVFDNRQEVFQRFVYKKE